MKNRFLILTATHGNEGFSVNVLQELEKEFPCNVYGYDWIISNEKAFQKNVRFIDVDLNRSALGDKKSNKYEEKRAAEIIGLSKEYDFVIDIHGTNSTFGIVKIIPYPTFPNLILASMFAPPRNVIWYAKESQKKGPLVQFTHCPAIELECGPKNNEKTKLLLKKVLEEFIKSYKTFSKESIFGNIKKQEFYSVYGKEIRDTIKRNDFELVKNSNEEFYPFLANNDYKDISYYKMKKVKVEEYFLC